MRAATRVNAEQASKRVALCEPNSHRSHAFCAEFARQSLPAKFRFPDHEMERPKQRLSAFRLQQGEFAARGKERDGLAELGLE